LRLIAYSPMAKNDAVTMKIGGVSGTMKPGRQGGTRMLKKAAQTPDRATARTSILASVDGSVMVKARGAVPMPLPPRNGPKV